jgi:hypothetical protein
MERSRLLVTDRAAHAPRQASVSLIFDVRQKENMKMLADETARVEVTPADDVWLSGGKSTVYLDDRSPFVIEIADWLSDGHIHYGLFGPVIDGPSRYRGLVCSLFTRVDGDDWRNKSASWANFKVGPSSAYRNHQFDFRHPEGTKVEGFPVLGRFAEIKVIE